MSLKQHHQVLRAAKNVADNYKTIYNIYKIFIKKNVQLLI